MDPPSPRASPRFAHTFGLFFLLSLAIAADRGAHGGEQLLRPASMSRIGAVDERFKSYNIEMVEVTGGPFWRPYDLGPLPGLRDQDLYAYRPPIDLANA